MAQVQMNFVIREESISEFPVLSREECWLFARGDYDLLPKQVHLWRRRELLELVPVLLPARLAHIALGRQF